MKKKLVDLTYFSFPDTNAEDIIVKCQSTIGFLEKMNDKFEVHFVVRSENGFPSVHHNTIHIHFFKGETLKKWQIPFRFNNYIKSLKPDYVLVHGFGFAHYLCFFKLINRKTKIVLQCNGFAPKPKGLKKWVYQLADPYIDGYMFTGIENSRDWYDSGIIRKEKIFEIMEGSTTFKFQGNTNRSNRSYLWVGGLVIGKDPLTIIKAFHEFLIVEPLAKLTMIYQDDRLLMEISEFISSHINLKSNVILKGFVPHPLLGEIYNQNQFFILGSHYEGSGYALVEAMACGCIPIVTRIPPFEYMTNNGDCGFLFEPKSSESLLQQLKAAQTCDLQKMQNKVLQQFEDKLSFRAIAVGIDAVFTQLQV